MLVVVRTHTTLSWLDDLLPALLADLRLQIVFTIHRGSAFAAGLTEAVRSIGAILIPWEQAIATSFKLAIAASRGAELSQLRSPLLVVPHGPGYTRALTMRDESALPMPSMGWGPTPALTLALTHPEQQRRERLPPSARAVVVGDPCLDVLDESLEHRDAYRKALGVVHGRRLVLFSSTWGPYSLLAKQPELIMRTLADLPTDEYSVAAVLHHNIWSGHGAWQVRAWLKPALEAGLLLLPPERGWRAAVIAADTVIGDHGSVTFYAAVTGTPVVLAAFGSKELVPGTALAALGDRAPHLQSGQSVRRHLQRVGPRDPDRYRDLADAIFDVRGGSLGALRRLAYELLDLQAPPATPRVLPAPLPRLTANSCTAHVVRARVVWSSPTTDGKAIELERFPASVHRLDAAGDPPHLAVYTSEPDRRLRSSADVLVADNADNLDTAAARAGALLSQYPGCRVVAVPTGSRVVIAERDRDPRWYALASAAMGDEALLASAVFVLAVADKTPDVGQDAFIVTCGTHTVQVPRGSVLMPADQAASGDR